MQFPDYKTWVETVLNPKDRNGGSGPYCFEEPKWHANYAIKYQIAKAFAPTSIIEVGVRYGYSAHAFLCACPEARYIGVDLDSPTVNSMGEGTCDWALDMLARTNPWKLSLKLLRVDTQAVDVGPMLPQADLVHIDAAHTYQGATRDMETLWPNCTRVMLVDDYLGTGSVHDAVDAFVARHKATLLTAKSQNGEALILR